jgi:hypothetical protein
MKTILISQWRTVLKPLLASVLFAAFPVFGQINLPIGDMAPGDSITITFDVVVTNPFPAGVSSITNHGTMSGSNFNTVNSDDPTTNPQGDPTITTVEAPPTVITLAASGVTTTNATLNASVDPNGLAGGVYFEFGLSTSYGSFTATNVLAANNITVFPSALISNLAPALYHFRATATNSAGKSFGNDLTFATIPIPPARLINSALTNGQFRFSFTNFAGQTFTVLGSTNLALPSSNWTVLGPVTEGSPGQFQFTDPQSATNRQLYYRVRWP